MLKAIYSVSIYGLRSPHDSFINKNDIKRENTWLITWHANVYPSFYKDDAVK